MFYDLEIDVKRAMLVVLSFYLLFVGKVPIFSHTFSYLNETHDEAPMDIITIISFNILHK